MAKHELDADGDASFVGVALKMLVLTIAYASVFYYLWSWFVIDAIRAEPINFPEALGLVVLVRWVLWQDTPSGASWGGLVHAGLALVVGFVAHLFK